MTKERISNDDIIPERPQLPENVKATEAHMIINNMGLVASRLEQIADGDGGFRTKHFGAWLGVNIIPHLDKQVAGPEAPLVLPEPPCVLIAGDTLDELGARLKFEIDVMVDTAKDVIDGKIKLNDRGAPIMVNDPKEEMTDGNDIEAGQVAESAG